jgi:hypothetical protein
MTGLNVEYIWKEFPLVIGRQYEQIFYAKHSIQCEGAGQAQAQSGLTRIME